MPGPWFFGASLSPSSVLSAPGCLACSAHPPQLPMEAHHSGAPGAWLWCLSAHCTCRLLCLWLAAHFLPLLFGAPRPRSASCLVVMSCVSLQLNSRCWPRLRTPSRSASPGSWAPLDLVAPQLLPLLAHPQLPPPPQRPRWRPRPATRSQRLCCAQRLSRLPPLGLALAPALLRRCPNVHRVAAPAPPLACMVRSLSRSRDWSRAWPPSVAHQSLLPSYAFPASLALSTLLQSVRRHLSTPLGLLHPQPRPPRPPVLRRLRPTPMMTGTLSSTHTASPRLLVAPRPPSPSRSAPCGGKSDVLSPVLCAFSAGVASLAVCLVLDTSTLLRIMGKSWWTWSFPALPAQNVGFFWRCLRWPWRGGQFGNSEDAEKPNKSYYDPRKWLREVEFIMVERVQRSCVDHSNVNWSCSQHVCMKPPLAVMFTLFRVRQTHWTCGCTR